MAWELGKLIYLGHGEVSFLRIKSKYDFHCEYFNQPSYFSECFISSLLNPIQSSLGTENAGLLSWSRSIEMRIGAKDFLR